MTGVAQILPPRRVETSGLAAEAKAVQAAGQGIRSEIYWRELVGRSPENVEALLGVAEQLCARRQAANALVYATRALIKGASDEPVLRLIHDILSDLAGRETISASTSAEDMADQCVEILKEVDASVLWPSARLQIAGLLIRMGVDEKLVRPEVGADQSAELQGIREPEILLTRFRESRGEGIMPETIVNAIERLAKATSDAEAWFVLGRDSMGRDETETAQELFRRAAFLEPGRIKYRINLARALAANAIYADAYRAFQSVTALTPESRVDHSHQEEANANRRSLLSRLILQVRQAIAEGDDARAWSTYQLISSEPDMPDADGMRAAILRLSIDAVMAAHKRGDPQVITLSRQHLERDPESVYVRQVLGQALMAAERFREAAELWGTLTVSLPENARMLLQYAKCLERSGAGEAAYEAAERALALEPELESAQIIRDRLAN